MLCQRIFLVVVAVAVLMGVTNVEAVILVNEDFSHNSTVDPVPLVGLTPTPGPGAAWTPHKDDGFAPIQVSGGEVTLAQGEVPDGGGGFTTGEDVHSDFPVQSATAVTYARFDFRLPAASNSGINLLDDDGLYFAHLSRPGATSNGFVARTGVIYDPLAATGDFGLGMNSNGSRLDDGVAWPSQLDFDTTYRVVISFDTGNGVSELWLNPANASSPSITDSGGSGTLVESFGLRQSDDYVGSIIVDNLVVATSFDEALTGIAVPEPSGIALTFGVVLGISALRRRRE